MNKSTSDHPVSYDCEKVMPDAASDAPKQQQVERMFDDISDSYDSLNRMMTAGLDLRWRRKALSFLRPFKPKHILDEATGTGDFALMACRIFPDASVVGMDISEGMMRVGREKAKRMGLTSRMTFRRADSMALDIPDASFDAVTIAFGVRNFAHLEQGIAETSRVLTADGHLLILEMSRPYVLFRPFYWIYTKGIIPLMGRLFSKESAYRYLPSSIEAFPHGRPMVDLLRRCGFESVIVRRYTFGVCTLYFALKSSTKSEKNV